MTHWHKIMVGFPAMATVVLLSAVVVIANAQGTRLANCPSSRSPHAVNEENNKKITIDFYNKALNEKNPTEALKYIGAYYKQHNPTAEDGRDGFQKFIEWVRSDHPDSHSEIKQVFADGDYVIMNVHMVRFPGERGLAIGEIFRLEGGKIVEHWDRIQAVPEAAKNNNGMF
jgi:predicted SnoaL-like aldol condensation-catalyzing enzyme